MNSTTEDHVVAPAKKHTMSTKVKAIVAGGLVLGVGAAITLAAWNDSEFATGTFTAGTFNLEGSTDGTAWAEHPAAGSAATLTFAVNPTALSPGDVVYAPFAVRLDDTTTNPAGVAITVASSTGTTTNLSYELIQPTAFGCDSTTTGTSLVTAGTPIAQVAGAAAFSLTEGTPPTTAGAPAFLCFKVTAGAITQGQTATVVWQFAAASTAT